MFHRISRLAEMTYKNIDILRNMGSEKLKVSTQVQGVLL
jgi:hypothetical protein